MSGVLEIRNHLLEELELAVRTSEGLIRRIQQEQWDYRPQDNMRTLLELVHHLVMIPASDLAILQEKPQPEVEKLETSLADVRDTAALAEQFRRNFEAAKHYFESLSEEELLHKSTKAFYLEHGAVQSKWLIEIVTHTFHHRSQLYNYLKQLGHDLNFFVLYS
ncbi:DinB family protein [Paenibacillus rigui]|uniref:Damage-inducible protein DinB n=1 Tax=Paenibacillus rigui TaxID=554312 RepID=A0A229UQN2_9BACL|nr:DinB family protein [Paenibacillus rigui]OXM85724.1 damage-inducible protein DinB [Paenibacillus rigui]